MVCRIRFGCCRLQKQEHSITLVRNKDKNWITEISVKKYLKRRKYMGNDWMRQNDKGAEWWFDEIKSDK